ncbi:zinc finger protein 568-like [Anoplophora glabripennis]|uniref:zinc finger protein 568-like n=2 Tax=Anoplophora glabripennis TaxID=217634 RepID=UPI0008739172|nr:zinc finger protein 568-like [Anoplophora glabripennis]
MQMENVCRTCLRSSDKLLPLIGDENLVQKIEFISSIQIFANDYYPPTICEECVINVNKFFCFRKVIINSDIELRERYDTLKRTNFTSKPRTKEKEKHPTSAVKRETEMNESDVEDTGDLYEDSDNADIAREHEIKEVILKEPSLNDIKNTIAHLKRSKCNECSLTFSSRIKLYNHRRSIHMAPGVCNICGIVMRTDNLKRHVQMHLEGPVTCNVCGKVFKNPESLRGHTLIHKGIIYTCQICGKTSRVKSEHHRHVKTHTDPEARKVMCTLCGKRVRDLKKHTQSHTGERPHSCTFCKKGFTSPYALKIHTRQHTNERPFICEYCSMGFPQKVSLTTHLKSKHNVMSK